MGYYEDTLELSEELPILIVPPMTPNPKSKRAVNINSPTMHPMIHPAHPQNIYPDFSTDPTLLSL